MKPKRVVIVVIALFLASIIAGTIQATPIEGISEAKRTALGIAVSTPVGLLVFGIVGSNFDLDGYIDDRSGAAKFGDLVFVEFAAIIVGLGLAAAFEGMLGATAGWVGAGAGYLAAFTTFMWRANDYLNDPNVEDDE
ncbi:hypothetical protein [Haloarchaeobius sp. DFWS5]|uniref:hypothetical protein n=1 Tax=Haloarchaeobius sp. DFWS5 TaxID=3446114 RepID=UPI003EBB1403